MPLIEEVTPGEVVAAAKEPTPKFGLKKEGALLKTLSDNVVGPKEDGFEVVTKGKPTRKGSSEDESEEEEEMKVPLYLGISLHQDKELYSKFKQLLKGVLPKLEESQLGGAAVKDMIEELSQASASGFKKEINGWKKPDDFHVTTFYIGKDEDKLKSEFYTNFARDVEVPVRITAVVLVPGKIITGIAFPDHAVQNRCPHVTMMVNEWKPMMSNSLLEESCARGPFAEVYDDLKHGRPIKENKQVLTGQIKVDKKGVNISCYIVVLDEPVEFFGVTKIYA